ncbi:MAG TPA: hypothetical protein VK177_01060 [Flavobacteriales bacterium]|nr:hypothetical protein [Flavobacteriales bacterium]
MKNSLIIALILVLIQGCGGTKKDSRTRADALIADKVESKKTGDHLQLPGTRIFVVPPKTFVFNKQLIRLQKDVKNYLQFMDVPGNNYNDRKKKVLNEYENAEKKGATIHFKKEYTLNGYSAFMMHAASPNKGIDQLIFMMGDESFTVLAVGQLAAGDTVTRDEMMGALKSVYYDKEAVIDVADLQTYTVDMEGSDFKFASNASQMFSYTVGGKGNPLNDVFIDEILIMTLPGTKNFEELEKFAVSNIEKLKSTGMSIPSYKQTKIKVGDYDATEVVFEGEFSGKPNSVYIVITGNEKATVYFCGGAYSNRAEYMKQFKKIAQTLRIKE